VHVMPSASGRSLPAELGRAAGCRHRYTALAAHAGRWPDDLAGHMLDQIVWALGRPTEMTAFLRRDGGDVPGFDDNTLAVLAYPRALVFVDIAAMEPIPMARRFEVYGSRGASSRSRPSRPARSGSAWSRPRASGPPASSESPCARGHAGSSTSWSYGPFVATFRGQKSPDRPLDHELLVQETLLRATGRIPS
jgi:predicted dehydrogenase